MLLLHNRDQQQNNPIASLATCLCSQSSGNEWTASSPLHDTRTMNLAIGVREGILLDGAAGKNCPENSNLPW